MRQIPTIALNAFMELVRQPVFLLLFTLAPLIMIVMAAVPYFGFGGTTTGAVNFDVKMVKDGALTVTFLSGLLAAVLCASSSLANEISSGTALAVLSKPVSRLHFILGKYFGIVGAITLGAYFNLIGTLLASRQAYDAYGNPDLVGIITFFIFIGLAYLLAAAANYFMQKPFVPTAVTFMAIGMTIGFLVICMQEKTTAWYYVDSGAGIEASFWDIWKFTENSGLKDGEIWAKRDQDRLFFAEVDLGLLQLSALLLLGLWILSAIALCCSTRLSWMPSLMICSGVFILGLMSDYMVGKAATGGGVLRPGEYLLWEPSSKEPAVEDAFDMEPRGIRRISGLNYSVRLNLTQVEKATGNFVSPYQGETLDNGVLTVDYGITNSVRLTYENLREKVEIDLKTNWNDPIYETMLLVGRQLMPGEFPVEPWEGSFSKTSTQYREKRFLLLDRMMVALEEKQTDLERDPATKDRWENFQYLASQAKLKTTPGHLAFWVFPGDGKLMKWDERQEKHVPLHEGHGWAKILYVLIPNWQLFWLSDSVTPEAEELAELRASMSYREGHVPWKYVGSASLYAGFYILVMLAGAIWLFENRELS